MKRGDRMQRTGTWGQCGVREGYDRGWSKKGRPRGDGGMCVREYKEEARERIKIE